MRAVSRDRETPDLDLAIAPLRDLTGSHRRIIPPMAVHGATSLERKAAAVTARRRTTEVRRQLVSLPRQPIRRGAAGDRPRDRTRLRARATLLRDHIQVQARAVTAAAGRPDLTRLQARPIPLRGRFQVQARALRWRRIVQILFGSESELFVSAVVFRIASIRRRFGLLRRTLGRKLWLLGWPFRGRFRILRWTLGRRLGFLGRPFGRGRRTPPVGPFRSVAA